MKKLLLALLLLATLGCSVYAQGNRKIQYRADMGYYDEDVLQGAQRLVGNVAFVQDNVRGYCDSALLYEADNYIIALGNPVKILVGDSVKLYGRRANYDGNAHMASIAVRVRLEKGKVVLTSDSLIYDTRNEIGSYVTGGRLVNEEDTMTSIEGRYYTKTDDAFAKRDVNLWNDTYHIDCEEIQYNTVSKIAYFISPTHLLSNDQKQEIFTDRGWYDTDSELSTLVGNVKMYSESQSITADSVYYTREDRFGRAWNNVCVVDTAENYILKGNYVEYHELGGISFATDSTLAIYIDENRDSVFLHADTIKVMFDDAHKAEWGRAYNHVKFYRSDMQGACDSLVYVAADSTTTMYFNPVLWTENYQLTADTIRYVSLENKLSRLEMIKAGFVVGGLFEDEDFNQIKGNYITGFLKDQELNRVDVLGNAECVYYLQEEDSSLIGINTSVTNEMRIFLDKNKIKQIRFYDVPDGKVYPDEKFEEKNRKLQDFRWLIAYRPKTIMELFVNPIPRYKSE